MLISNQVYNIQFEESPLRTFYFIRQCQHSTFQFPSSNVFGNTPIDIEPKVLSDKMQETFDLDQLIVKTAKGIRDSYSCRERPKRNSPGSVQEPKILMANF
jgi:hypothetical protein